MKRAILTVAVSGAIVLGTAGTADAHGYSQCGASVNVKIYRVSCNQAYKVLGHYIGSGFMDHKYNGWKCSGSFPSDGPGGLPGRLLRRSQTVNCQRNRRSSGHQHFKAKS